MSDTYDGAFRTIINDCRQFLLPFLNEVFGEHYDGSEQIEFRPNEHYIDQQDAPDKKRVTDTHFLVTSQVTDDVPGRETDKVADKITKQYHLECESSKYSPKILIRIFEYDAQIALDNADVGEDTISVRFPHTAVLYLRSTEKTPDTMHVVIEVPEDSIEYEVPVTKVSAYTIDEIFEKKLYILIPFYIFTYELQFGEYDTNEEKLESLKQEYQKIIDRLNDLTEKGEISSFDQRTIIELADDVIKELTRKYNNIQKKVGELMSGAMIQTEARKIRDEGRAFEIIRMSIKYNATKDEIITELVEELKMSKKQAEQYLKQYEQ
jgi:uncharacterized protein (UPF0297 family)